MPHSIGQFGRKGRGGLSVCGEFRIECGQQLSRFLLGKVVHVDVHQRIVATFGRHQQHIIYHLP